MGDNSDIETVDENQPPAEAGDAATTSTREDGDFVPKHLRHRYWNSFEEMRLVELWRLHSDEVTTLQKNIPVFRTIAEDMRAYGFHMNAQEARRRINTIKNKYIAERRRMDTSDVKTSDWRLYPLVHCLLAPRQKNQLLLHQKKILDQLFAKIPEDLLNKELPESEIVRIKQIAAPLPPIIQPTNHREPLTIPTSVTATHTRYQPTRFQPYIKGLTHESSIFLRKQFTKDRLTQIMMDNSILSRQRDIARNQLIAEERSFHALESFLMNWQKKHEHLLERLDGDVEGGTA